MLKRHPSKSQRTAKRKRRAVREFTEGVMDIYNSLVFQQRRHAAGRKGFRPRLT